MADIKIKKDHCPLILTHSLIGGKWKLKILWHILQGDNRFSELKKEIPGISEKVLYSNLKELEDARLLYREVIKEKKPSVIRYRLSEEGVEVRALIDAAHRFANRYAKSIYILKSKVLRNVSELCIVFLSVDKTYFFTHMLAKTNKSK